MSSPLSTSDGVRVLVSRVQVIASWLLCVCALLALSGEQELFSLPNWRGRDSTRRVLLLSPSALRTTH